MKKGRPMFERTKELKLSPVRRSLSARHHMLGFDWWIDVYAPCDFLIVAFAFGEAKIYCSFIHYRTKPHLTGLMRLNFFICLTSLF